MGFEDHHLNRTKGFLDDIGQAQGHSEHGVWAQSRAQINHTTAAFRFFSDGMVPVSRIGGGSRDTLAELGKDPHD